MSDDEIVDLVFALSGRAVALDYADRLWRELAACLPWLGDEAAAGVHPLAGVAEGPGELLFSRRARLTLRLPSGRCEAAQALCGKTLDLSGEVIVGAASRRPLAAAKVMYSSFVTQGTTDEASFLATCRQELAASGIDADLVAGKPQRGRGEDGQWHGFSLMLHGLGSEASLRLQRQGLGGERKRGCGIFVPHKAIAAVGE